MENNRKTRISRTSLISISIIPSKRVQRRQGNVNEAKAWIEWRNKMLRGEKLKAQDFKKFVSLANEEVTILKDPRIRIVICASKTAELLRDYGFFLSSLCSATIPVWLLPESFSIFTPFQISGKIIRRT